MDTTAKPSAISLETLIPYLTCPLTKRIFRYPVIADDNCVYEAYELYKYLKSHDNRSPTYNTKKIKDYIHVLPLRSFVDLLAENNEFLESNRYSEKTLPKIHTMCLDEISTIFAKKSYKDILKYTEFDLKIISKQLFKLIELTSSDKTVIPYIIHIISNSTNVNAEVYYDKWTIFNYICVFGSSELINVMIDLDGVNLENKCNDGNRPIHQIARRSTGENVIKIIAKGINITADALEHIFKYQDSKTVASILSNNKILIPPEIVNNFQKYLQDNAKIEPEQHEELITILLSKTEQ